MKKFASMIILLALVSVAFANNADLTAPTSAVPPHVFKASQRPGGMPYTGPCATPTLVDTINLSPINSAGYCWGLAYDWERDALWVTQWNSAYPKMYAIQKHSPCTKVDSVTLGSGVPTYRLGIGYAGSNVMYMAGYDNTVYRINMTTGTGTSYRTLPWSTCEGLDYNVVNDALYASDWGANQAAWAIPSQTGTWQTWSRPQYPCGMSGAYSATTAPTLLFQAEEANPAHFYQFRLTNGVPNTTPESVWTCDPGQTQGYEADCAFDGQYVYILDQSGPDKIWVYDVGIILDDTIRWTFETGWQGWTHTSSYTFPNAWGVAQSNLHSGWMPPNAQDSCLWFDDDAAGSGAPPLKDTALSPVIVPHSTTNWLKWGVTYNYLGSPEKLEVGIKYFDGSTWTVVPLKTYTADIAGAWDSADVSAYKTYPRLQVYAYYDDGNGWQWYGAIDNVTINGELYVAQHDVGTTAINQPPDNLLPNTSYTPTATYKNFGNNDETFNVYFQIDSSGTTVYNQSQSLVLNAGEDTTITFPNWTTGPNEGITYNITVYTALAGDVNPVNDTLHTTTTTSLVGIWVQCQDMPNAELSNATGYDPVNDRVYSFGGTPDGGYTYHNYTFCYDPAGNAWTTRANMPYAGDWIDASFVNGKFYIFGLFDGSVHNYTMIYDVAGNSWTTGTNMPQARIAGGQVVYKDSLIYMLGGYSGSAPTNNVQIYDVYNNTWTTGTNLPANFMMGGVAMTGDTIWIVGGYNGSACYTNLYYGIINPSNPQNITWSTGAALPVPNFNNGATQMTRNGSRYLYMVGGFENASTATNKAWEYDVANNVWNALPDYPFPVVRNDFLVAREGHREIYVCGGDDNGDWTGTAQTWKLPWYEAPGVEEKEGSSQITLNFGFAQNMPNPTKGSIISYTIPRDMKVSLKVFDASGRLVSTLVNAYQTAGTKTVEWNTQNLTNGIYFVRLEAEGRVATQKLILVK